MRECNHHQLFFYLKGDFCLCAVDQQMLFFFYHHKNLLFRDQDSDQEISTVIVINQILISADVVMWRY